MIVRRNAGRLMERVERFEVKERLQLRLATQPE